LQRRGVDAHGLDPAQDGLHSLIQGQFDRAFIALHGRFGEDGVVQGALEWLQIPYTGSGVTASAVAMDKILTKVLWMAEGLPTPPYMRLQPGFQPEAVVKAVGLPCIVKPAREGSTLGLTKVHTLDALQAAFELAYQFDPHVLAERLIEGTELTVPILGEGPGAQALPVIRIQAPGGNYDYHNKYLSNDTQYFCPSGLPEALERRVQELCVRAYRVLGCAGWGRADVFVDANNQAWLLEINTSPGMTDHSLVPMSAKAAGVNYEDLVLNLTASARLHTALERSGA
jgi:D-alanine-D-alanine ligase